MESIILLRTKTKYLKYAHLIKKYTFYVLSKLKNLFTFLTILSLLVARHTLKNKYIKTYKKKKPWILFNIIIPYSIPVGV